MTSSETREIIPGYEILRKLGQGGMGAVYEARQKSMDRIVALKVLPRRLAKQQDFKERFFREARAAGRLNHPHIVSAFDAQEAGGYCYIAMEFVEGEPVSSKINREGALDPGTTLSIVAQIADGLSHAWKSGIIHRDVKPENFLLTPAGVAKLCDLGIAKAPAEDAGLTQDGTALGTPRYIAPEQAQGKPDVDHRADIYSLGASAYHMISGSPPFEGETAPAIMLKHISEPLPPLRQRAPAVSAEFASVIERMMSKKPDDRHSTAEELLDDLQALQRGEPPPHTKIRRSSQRGTVRRPPAAARGRIGTGQYSNSGRSTATRGFEAIRPPGMSPAMRSLLLIGIVVVLLGLLYVALGQKEERPPVASSGNSAPAASAAPEPTASAIPDLNLARQAFARGQEFERSQSMQEALQAYRRVVKDWPRSPFAPQAADRIAAIEKEMANAAAEQAAEKRIDQAAQAFSALQQRQQDMPLEELLGELQKFREQWKNTPSADQAMAEARSIEAQVGQANALAAEMPAAHALLQSEEWPQMLPVLNVMRWGGPELAELGPDAQRVAESAPQAQIRSAAITALARIAPDRLKTIAPDLLQDRNEYVRLAVLQAARDLRLAELRPAAEKLLSDNPAQRDPSPTVRQAAERLLKALP